MSTIAEPLRRAASLLRERASAATPGPWRVSFIDGAIPVVDSTAGDHLVAELHPCGDAAHGGRQRADAEWIAGMDPLAGLALAGLLEAFASCGCEEDGDHWPEKSAALRLARLVLGEPETEGEAPC
jgi:hypothetical protein